jgi:hypothetical protein
MLETLMGGGGDRDSRLLMEIFLQKGGVIMKRNVVSCLMLGAFTLVLTGMPLQLLHIDFAKSAYAMHSSGLSNKDDWEKIRNQADDLGKPLGKNDKGDDILEKVSHQVDDRGKLLSKDDSRNSNLSEYDKGEKTHGPDDILDKVLYQFDGQEKFRVKDDDCKDFLDQVEHGRRGHRRIGYYGRYDDGCDGRSRKHKDHHEHDHCKVPEPSMFSLLGAGIAGVGVYSFIRRRNHK